MIFANEYIEVVSFGTLINGARCILAFFTACSSFHNGRMLGRPPKPNWDPRIESDSTQQICICTK